MPILRTYFGIFVLHFMNSQWRIPYNFARLSTMILFSQEENQRQLFRKIRMGEFEYFQEDWEDISVPAKDLISKLLVVDPSRRIKAQAALQHEWICKVDDEDLSARSLSSSLDSLRSSLKSIQTEEGYTAEWLIEGREMIE